MDAKQNPFSLYDFLGYFTPGAVFLYGLVAVANRFFGYKLHESFTAQGFNGGETTVALVLLAYILGHSLSFLSSVIVEKFSIWMHGYPSKYLLNSKHCGYLKNKGKDGEEEDLDSMPKVIRGLVWLFMLPVAVLDKVLGDWLNARNVYVKVLDDGLSQIILEKSEALLADKSDLHELPDDFFRFVTHYALVNSEHHITSLKNYVALYGFTRTMTFLCILAFWGSLFVVSFSGSESNVMKTILVVSIPFSYIYYMAFNKFNRRFTLEAFMALAVNYEKKSKINPIKVNK
jgi:hypothetical protein